MTLSSTPEPSAETVSVASLLAMVDAAFVSPEVAALGMAKAAARRNERTLGIVSTSN